MNDKFDMLTNKNSKNFFYQFNNYLRQINEKVKLIRLMKLFLKFYKTETGNILLKEF